MSTLAQAIANAEGYGQPGAIPTQTNNPGDLKIGDVGNGTINGITVFGSQQSGMDALNNQINLMTSGKSSVYTPNETLSQIGDTWSGGDPNWAKNVASSLGVSTSTPLSNVSNDNPSPFSWAGIKMLFGGMASTESVAGLPVANSSGQLLNAPVKNGVDYSTLLPRGVIIVLGLILIFGGVMMLKSTSTIIKTAGKIGAKAVEVSA